MRPVSGKTLLALAAGAVVLLAVGGAAGYGLRALHDRARYEAALRERVLHRAEAGSYRSRLSHFAALPDGPTTVMLGDSLTSGAQWSELLGTPVANRGMGGDTVGMVRARLASSVPPSTRRVFLMAGINDMIQADSSPSAAARQTAAVVQALKGKTVYVQSVLYTRDPAVNARVRTLNSLNRDFCATGACTYLDIAAAIQPDQVMPPEISYDGVHLDGAAYERWAAVIRPRMAAR